MINLRRIYNEKGYTLLEMILVLAIMGVLITIIGQNIPAFLRTAGRIKAIENGRMFHIAMEQGVAILNERGEAIEWNYDAVDEVGNVQHEIRFLTQTVTGPESATGDRNNLIEIIEELLGGEEIMKTRFSWKNKGKDLKLIVHPESNTIDTQKISSNPDVGASAGSYVWVTHNGSKRARYYFSTQSTNKNP